MSGAYDAIVVGAGPAGMMASGRAGERGLRILLLDGNARPGRKLLITGKGRCNVTNDCDVDTFLKNVRRNPRFLYSAASAFSPADTMAFFEAQGVPLKTERGRRVFPESDRSADILMGLRRYCEASGVRYEQGRVQAVLTRDGTVSGVKTTDGRTVEAKRVVLATGGLSYPATGSDGGGYRLARTLGHRVTETRPSLIPILTAERWCGDLSGLSLRNVTLTLRRGNKQVFSELGEMLFTHFGVSGPLVLSASSHMTEDIKSYTLTVDLKPALDGDKLDKRILRDFDEAPNKDFANSLDALLPKSLIPVIVGLSGIPPQTKVHQVSREDRLRLGALLKALPLTPTGFRPIGEAVVTSGGVDVRDLNPKTMESKILPGLYFAGEILDLDAYTGGYNLQIAFSTGYAAGSNLGEDD